MSRVYCHVSLWQATVAQLLHGTAGHLQVEQSGCGANGWFLFAGVNAHYMANQIFLDGNTFDNDDQESMEYDNGALGVTLGVTHAWQNISWPSR
jgi:hypothetical protein